MVNFSRYCIFTPQIKLGLVQVRKKRTIKDIIGLVKAEGDAVKSKKSLQKGLNDLT